VHTCAHTRTHAHDISVALGGIACALRDSVSRKRAHHRHAQHTRCAVHSTHSPTRTAHGSRRRRRRRTSPAHPPPALNSVSSSLRNEHISHRVAARLWRADVVALAAVSTRPTCERDSKIETISKMHPPVPLSLRRRTSDS
jgi:hypothetical protein